MDDASRQGSAPIRVGIGLVSRLGRYLVRKRPALPGSPMPGLWEFPGGKCEPGESVEDAVRRECLEETGLSVRLIGLRQCRRHSYPHGFVELHYFDCVTADPAGEPEMDSGFIWVDAGILQTLEFPEANEPVLRELSSEALAQSSSIADERAEISK